MHTPEQDRTVQSLARLVVLGGFGLETGPNLNRTKPDAVFRFKHISLDEHIVPFHLNESPSNVDVSMRFGLTKKPERAEVQTHLNAKLNLNLHSGSAFRVKDSEPELNRTLPALSTCPRPKFPRLREDTIIPARPFTLYSNKVGCQMGEQKVYSNAPELTAVVDKCFLIVPDSGADLSSGLGGTIDHKASRITRGCDGYCLGNTLKNETELEKASCVENIMLNGTAICSQVERGYELQPQLQ
ncbi:hypothetical protein B0H10DRAFT_1937786 [Mycena sp. CBHHK59/15]|nr:hypothetical protein B0H10DRAFT_1937786 [Mycena sp. CBHHK59/15]